MCMPDTTWKLYEMILCIRVEEAIDKERTGQAENQYGFRKGQSTVDAIFAIMTEVADNRTGTIYKRLLCVLITLNVANALRSALWITLASKNVPGYFTRAT